MIKSIIVEDDPKYSDSLLRLLQKLAPDVTITATAGNVEEAVTAIEKLQPDLIFLDIELGEGTGFDILNRVSIIDFDVIFTTAHIDKNILAIRACGISYLPKPIIAAELEESLKKFREKQGGSRGKDQVNTLKTNLHTTHAADKTIWINEGSDYRPVEVKNIIYCTSSNQYTDFFIASDIIGVQKWRSVKGLGEWEHDLEPFGFCRVHNRHLVNMKHIIKYTRGDGGTLTMSDNATLDVSKERKQKFLRLVGMK